MRPRSVARREPRLRVRVPSETHLRGPAGRVETSKCRSVGSARNPPPQGGSPRPTRDAREAETLVKDLLVQCRKGGPDGGAQDRYSDVPAARSWFGPRARCRSSRPRSVCRRTSARSSAATSPPRPQADRLKPSGSRKVENSIPTPGGLVPAPADLGLQRAARAPAATRWTRTNLQSPWAVPRRERRRRGDVSMVASSSAQHEHAAPEPHVSPRELPALAEVDPDPANPQDISNSRPSAVPFRKRSRTTRCDTLTEGSVRPTPRIMAQQAAVPDRVPAGWSSAAVLRGLQRGRRVPPPLGAHAHRRRGAVFATAPMNAVPLYFNKLHARALATRVPRCTLCLLMNVVFGMTVEDLSRAGHRHLGYWKQRFRAGCIRGTR